MIIWVLLGFFTMGLPLMLTKPEIVCIVVKDEITLEEYCEFNMNNIIKKNFKLVIPDSTSLILDLDLWDNENDIAWC